MDDLIKLLVPFVVIAAVIVLFAYGLAIFDIPIVLGYLLWRFGLRDFIHHQKWAATFSFSRSSL